MIESLGWDHVRWKSSELKNPASLILIVATILLVMAGLTLLLMRTIGLSLNSFDISFGPLGDKVAAPANIKLGPQKMSDVRLGGVKLNSKGKGVITIGRLNNRNIGVEITFSQGLATVTAQTTKEGGNGLKGVLKGFKIEDEEEWRDDDGTSYVMFTLGQRFRASELDPLVKSLASGCGISNEDTVVVTVGLT